jgi:DNA-binding response OmpR family regulator
MKVLVVDDDSNLATTIQQGLGSFAHTVDIADNGADGAFMAKSYENDAIILDYSMPKKDGLAVCREVRAAGKTTPILFLSNTSDVSLKVQAFKAGADDYITKPFSMEELRARLEAITRRTPQIRQGIFTVGDVTLDADKMVVQRAGNDVHLTRKEFMMLEYFMRHSGKLLSRTQIMEHVWSADGNPFSNTVEAHIRNLRLKLNAGGLPNMIANIPARGYLIDAAENLAHLK